MTTPARRAVGEGADAIGLYLRNVGRHPLLDKAQEAALAQAIEAGQAARRQLAESCGTVDDTDRRHLDQQIRAGVLAKALFVESNLRLVVLLAQRRQASGVPLADLQFDRGASDSWRTEVERLLGGLGDRQREVLRLRFGLDGGEMLSLGETGRRLGLTGERVRQIQVAALAKLREAASEETRDDVLLSA